MNRRNFITMTGATVTGLGMALGADAQTKHSMETKKRIFAYGAGTNPKLVKYLAGMTGKSDPRICYLPTASADNANSISAWYEQCVPMGIRPYVQRMFISSYNQTQTFEEVLLSMDAIVVGGGNTLNMMAIWKAQGIDVILKAAWEKGIILAGGSAGSLCWFEHGTTDSRPKEISKVDCLGFIRASHCPHYDSEPTRRPLYHSYIKSNAFKPGYACDDRAGIVFEDNEPAKVVVADEKSNAYYVYLEKGEVKEKQFDKEVLR